MNVEFAFARDDEGRDLFTPWQPWSDVAYVIPSAEIGSTLRSRVRWHMRVSMALVALYLPFHFTEGFPWWVLPGLVVAQVGAFSWRARRFSTGLEQVRFRSTYRQRLRTAVRDTPRGKLWGNMGALVFGLIMSALLVQAGIGWVGIAGAIACAIGVAWSGWLLWYQSRRSSKGADPASTWIGR